MEKVNKIISHRLWRDCLEQIKKAEENRIFCKHDFSHFLDVARIAYIENLEKGLSVSKEAIYASALLHDIGRHLQYAEGIPHEKASSVLAKKILSDCGFDERLQQQILYAIDSHRQTESAAVSDQLAGLLYRADKKSRNCMFCAVQGECNRSREKKNLNLYI